MLMVIGASHHEVDLARLEGLGDSGPAVSERLAERLGDSDAALAGFVVLATCNRLEVYVDAHRFHEAVETVTDAVASGTGASTADVEALLHVRAGNPVGSHLLSVASGLDAMVVGEVEISGQVARAAERARESATLSPALHSLFRAAARTAKAVASETSLGAEGRSVASVALDLASAHDGGDPIRGRRVLLIGTGAMARVTFAALAEREAAEVLVASASGRAHTFAQTRNVRAIETADLAGALADVDVLVTTSGTRAAADLWVDGSLVRAIAARETPLSVVDLALGRDIPDAVHDVPGVHVVDLHSVSEAAGPAHGAELRRAQDIVTSASGELFDELAARSLDPAVVALRSHVHTALNEELRRLRRKYPDEVADDVERAMVRVTNTLLHTPTVRAKELARDGAGDAYIQALHTLFGIDVDGAHEVTTSDLARESGTPLRYTTPGSTTATGTLDVASIAEAMARR